MFYQPDLFLLKCAKNSVRYPSKHFGKAHSNIWHVRHQQPTDILLHVKLMPNNKLTKTDDVLSETMVNPRSPSGFLQYFALDFWTPN